LVCGLKAVYPTLGVLANRPTPCHSGDIVRRVTGWRAYPLAWMLRQDPCRQKTKEGKGTSIMASQQIALVTGANRGIGFEIARLLGERGMEVLVGARDRARGEEAAER